MTKAEAIRALDEALDGEIVRLAEMFAAKPDLRVLGVLAKLVTVDMYADKYLEEREEEAGTVAGMVGTVAGAR